MVGKWAAETGSFRLLINNCESNILRYLSNGTTMQLIKFSTTLLFLLATFTAQATTLDGKVIHIADGDTLTILTE